jgi:hypothetical protein
MRFAHTLDLRDVVAYDCIVESRYYHRVMGMVSAYQQVFRVVQQGSSLQNCSLSITARLTSRVHIFSYTNSCLVSNIILVLFYFWIIFNGFVPFWQFPSERRGDLHDRPAN